MLCGLMRTVKYTLRDRKAYFTVEFKPYTLKLGALVQPRGRLAADRARDRLTTRPPPAIARRTGTVVQHA